MRELGLAWRVSVTAVFFSLSFLVVSLFLIVLSEFCNWNSLKDASVISIYVWVTTLILALITGFIALNNYLKENKESKE